MNPFRVFICLWKCPLSVAVAYFPDVWFVPVTASILLGAAITKVFLPTPVPLLMAAAAAGTASPHAVISRLFCACCVRQLSAREGVWSSLLDCLAEPLLLSGRIRCPFVPPLALPRRCPLLNHLSVNYLSLHRDRTASAVQRYLWMASVWRHASHCASTGITSPGRSI
jgi:hypothetical protein